MIVTLEDNLDSESGRCTLYRRVLQEELQRVEQAKNGLHIPPLRWQWDTKCKLPFHGTPEIYFQVSGYTVFKLAEGEFTLGTDEVAIMPRGIPHWEIGHHGDKPFRMVVGMFLPESFSFHFASALDNNILAESQIDRFNVKDHMRLAEIVDEIVEANEEVQDTSHPRIRGLFMSYLAWALKRIDAEPEPVEDEPKLIQSCREKITAELARQDLSVIWLAKQLECSADHLSRAFHRFTGVRLNAYINDCRMNHAVHLLENTDLKVAAIAWSCGFRSPSSFNRVFHRQRGATPKAVRDRAQRAKD